MRFTTFLHSLMSLLSSARKVRRRSAPRRPAHRRLLLEALEERSLLSAYTIFDLGNLGGTSAFTAAYAVNDQAQVAGRTESSEGIRAFLWESGAGMQDLGQLQSGPNWARGINDLGQVVGDSNGRAFIWTAAAGMRSLGTGIATDINNAGQVVGWSYISGTNHAFLINPEDTNQDGAADLWYRDTDGNGINDLMLDLGALGGSASALGINNAGQVVGKVATYYSPPYPAIGYITSQQAFLWDSSSGAVLLGALPGDAGAGANDINDAGQVAGTSGSVGVEQSSPIARQTKFIQREAFVWQNGSMTGLGMLPGDGRSEAQGLNDSGQVVGSSVTLRWNGFSWVEQTRRGVVWDNGAPIDLNTTIDPALGWQIRGALAVNELGHIVGYGTINGQTRAFLMIPGAVVSLAVADVTVTEGSSGTVNAVFTVTRSGPLDQTATVAFATVNGTASAGSDYVANSGTLTFAPGETSKTITVVVNGDLVNEANETFVVRLSSPTGAFIGDGQGQGTIVNDDPVPTLSINDVSKVEGPSGITYFVFTVSLWGLSDRAITVNFATANGTAKTSDNDYVATSGTLTFAPGETTKTIMVQVKGDKKKEANETFFVNLSGALDALIADSQGLGTILNDD